MYSGDVLYTTCLVPSVRVIVVNLSGCAPAPAVGLPVLVSGDQVVAHPPVQDDVPVASDSNMYNVRPCPSTRYVPSGPVVVATTAAPEAAPEEAPGWTEDDAAPDRLDPIDPVGPADVVAVPDTAAEPDDGEAMAGVPDVDDPHPVTSTAVNAAPPTTRRTTPQRIDASIMITLRSNPNPAPAGPQPVSAPGSQAAADRRGPDEGGGVPRCASRSGRGVPGVPRSHRTARGCQVLPPEARPDFLRRQVLPSRNISGNRLTSFLMGGLNHEIEHHLFPSMPRPNLRRAQRIVRPFCTANSVTYTETTLRRSSAATSVLFGKGSRGRGPKTRLVPAINSVDALLDWWLTDVRHRHRKTGPQRVVTHPGTVAAVPVTPLAGQQRRVRIQPVVAELVESHS